MAELETLSLDNLDLVEVTQSDTDRDVSVNFPFSPEFPATTGLEIEARAGDAEGEIDAGDLAVHDVTTPSLGRQRSVTGTTR